MNNSALPSIALLPKLSKRFLQGYPWVYANEIVQSNESKLLQPGQCVQLTLSGKVIATGYYNRHSLIAFRVLSRDPSEIIDKHYFINRLSKATATRAFFYDTEHSPYFRLIHAEGDHLPGTIIDRFNELFVVQLNTQGSEQFRELLLEALDELFKPKTIFIKRDSSIRNLEGLQCEEPEQLGQPIKYLDLIENDLKFSIDFSTGQKTGWFYDHRENRRCIADLIKHSGGRIQKVIDYYCYSGGFALNAAKADTKKVKVIAVDRSQTALNNAKQSAKQNGLEENIEFVQAEVFQDMDERIIAKQSFDIVILDPPAFVKSKKDLAQGLKGYEKLITKGIQLTSKSGFLLIASCSFHVKLLDLQQCLMQALYKTNREARILKKLSAGPDHPIHPMLEESEYLKGFLIYIN